MYCNINCARVPATATPTLLLDTQYSTEESAILKGHLFTFTNYFWGNDCLYGFFLISHDVFYSKTISCRILIHHRRNSYVIINS